MIEFENPTILLLFALFPVIIIIHFISLLLFSRKAFKFANFETLRRISGQKKIFSKRLPQLILRLIFFSMIVIAAAQPVLWISTEGITESVVFAVDASGSMLADDFEPNRLSATKDSLLSFVENNTIEVGIISFTSVAYPELKPTKHNEKITQAIEGIKIRKASGTSLGQAINYATALLDTKDTEAKVIVFTDGQENVLAEDELLEVSKSVEENNIIPYFVGIGSKSGGNIGNETAGKSVLNKDLFELLTKEQGDYTIALNQNDIKESISEFLEEGEIEKKFELGLWIYLSAFLILIFEWYMANYFFRSFP